MDDARCVQKLVGYQEIRCRVIFNINMDGRFTRKACYVSSGHTTDPPSSIMYYCVLSKYSVIIVSTLATLNDVEIRASDIGNAYSNTKCLEKI